MPYGQRINGTFRNADGTGMISRGPRLIRGSKKTRSRGADMQGRDGLAPGVPPHLFTSVSLVVVAKGRSKDACGFSFSLLDMARNRLGLRGVRLTRPIFIAFPSFRLADFRNRLRGPQFCTKQSAASGFRNFEAGGVGPGGVC